MTKPDDCNVNKVPKFKASATDYAEEELI